MRSKHAKLSPDTYLVSSNTITTISPVAHAKDRVAVMGSIKSNHSGKEITPSFTHAASFSPSKTSTVGRATGQAGRNTVGVLMDNNTSFQVTISHRRNGVPDIHAHLSVLTIWGSSKVSVIISRAILGISNYSVSALAAFGIFLLEVS